MLSRVSGERIRHELYLILREEEPERALRRLDELKAFCRRSIPRLAGLEATWERFAALRQAVAAGQWAVPAKPERAAGAGPLPGPAHLPPDGGRSWRRWPAGSKIFRADLTLLHQVLDLREREAELDRPELSNREIYGLLQQSSSPAVLIHWLCTASARVRERLWHYETHLRQRAAGRRRRLPEEPGPQAVAPLSPAPPRRARCPPGRR